MRSFARVTKLTNIGGRGDYISNPARQEEIVMKSDPVDWQPYQEFERSHSTIHRQNNEGREVMIMLPNDWAMLHPAELHHRAQCLAEKAAGKSTDLQWAIHWNKTRTNLHMHVVFSERQKIENPGRWDRNVYLTAEKTVARRKADRALSEDGSFEPPVHRKGDLKDGFTTKDPEYRKKSWVYDMKEAVKAEMQRFGVEFDKPGILNEYHEGKGSESAVIRYKNQLIRANNHLLSGYQQQFAVPEKQLRNLGVDAVKQGKLVGMYKGKDERLHVRLMTPKEYSDLAAEIRSEVKIEAQKSVAAHESQGWERESTENPVAAHQHSTVAASAQPARKDLSQQVWNAQIEAERQRREKSTKKKNKPRSNEHDR